VKDWASALSSAITDDQTPLHRRALNEGFFDVFVNPSDVGGRYSALTLFGSSRRADRVRRCTPAGKGACMADACRIKDAGRTLAWRWARSWAQRARRTRQADAAAPAAARAACALDRAARR
jgi:hypothetical protein